MTTPAPDAAVEPRGPAAYAAELLGTLLLVLFIVLILSVQKGGLGTLDFAVIGLVHVFTLAMLVHTLGGTSGAHFNPAVTVALAVVRKIRPRDAGVYVVAQLAGGTLGALIGRALLVDEGRAVHYGATAVSGILSHGAFAGMVAEAIGTFALMWAIMGAAVNPRASASAAPWIIGGTLGMAVMVFGPVTGAGFNPARAFGPALVAGSFDGAGRFLLAFVAGPLVGAVIASVGYTALVLRPQEEAFGGRLVDADVPPGQVPGEVAALGTPGERPIDKLS